MDKQNLKDHEYANWRLDVGLIELSEFCYILGGIFIVPYITACASVQIVNIKYI